MLDPEEMSIAGLKRGALPPQYKKENSCLIACLSAFHLKYFPFNL